MRKLLLISVILLFIKPTAFSQDFGAVGTEWHYNLNDFSPVDRPGYIHYKSVKDTVINGQTTHKIIGKKYYQQSVSLYNVLYVYKFNDTVFLYNFGLNKFNIMMVYNLNQGDTLEIYKFYYSNSYKYVIDTVYNILIDGINHKQYKIKLLNSTTNQYDNIITDRIGLHNSFFIQHWIPRWEGSIRCFKDRLIDTNFNNYPCDEIQFVSINENKLTKNIKLYPNPSKENIILENTDKKRIHNLKIFAINGKLIKEVSFTNQKNKEIVSVKELPKGIYFVQVLVEDNLVNLKFIKE